MMQLILIFGIAIVVDVVVSMQSPAGSKCGQTQCSVIEYCSAFDSLCKPCLIICDGRNQTLCVRDCQEYLHDEKYALHAKLGEVGSLKEEVERLSTLVEVLNPPFALKIFLTLLILFLLLKTFLKLKIINEALVKIFGQKWIKSMKKSNDKVDNNVESSGSTVESQQQNNTQLIMPTISSNVATSSQRPNKCLTTNITSNLLSQCEIIKDTILNFAYITIQQCHQAQKQLHNKNPNMKALFQINSYIIRYNFHFNIL